MPDDQFQLLGTIKNIAKIIPFSFTHNENQMIQISRSQNIVKCVGITKENHNYPPQNQKTPYIILILKIQTIYYMGTYYSKENQDKVDKLKTEVHQLQDQGRYTKALKVYSEIIQLSQDPHDGGQSLKQSKVYEVGKEAIRSVTQSLELEKTADKYCILADLHNQMEEPDKAIQNYSKALEIRETYVEEDTKEFLEKSIVIKELPKIKQLVSQTIRIQQILNEQSTKDDIQMIGKASKDISTILKYNYNEAEEKAKEQKIEQLQDMMKKMMERVDVLELENKKMKEQQNHFYKNHELLFNQSLQSSTLSPQNQDVLKTYFTTFCSKMELFYQSLKLLSKIPDADLTLQEIYKHTSGTEEALIQIQKKLRYLIGHLQYAKGVLQQIPYVSIIFSIFKQFDKYFDKYIEHVHQEQKMVNILKSWMNSQVFNDFTGDIALRIVNKMKLRIINHSEPSFKNYLKVLWGKLVKFYRYKSEAAKIKELQHQHYNRKAYIAKLAQRDAAIIFYAFEIQKLKRNGDMDQMSDEIVNLIYEFDGMKIEEVLLPAKEQKKSRCLLF